MVVGRSIAAVVEAGILRSRRTDHLRLGVRRAGWVDRSQGQVRSPVEAGIRQSLAAEDSPAGADSLRAGRIRLVEEHSLGSSDSHQPELRMHHHLKNQNKGD